MTSETKPVIKKKEEHGVEFVPFGASDKIRLTASMIKQFIAVPTKSGALPSERDCIRFLMLCRGKRANPFEGDCFLIGYDTKNGASFSLVCGIDLFLKRAEQNPDYDGKESGVIVLRDGDIIERKGTLVLDGEILAGGWAKVYRKGHSQPEYKSVKFSTYNTGYGRWEKDPGGMIVKVAESQALRAAYPTALGGLYSQEEMQRVTEAGDGVVSVQEPIAPPTVIDVQEEPKKQEQEPGSQEQDTACVVIGEIKTKSGAGEKGPWTRYYFSDGNTQYSTFDEKLALALREQVGNTVTLRVQRTAKGINILGIESESQVSPDDAFVNG